MNLEYFKGKKIFVTGHTGFKGSWLCHILKNAGAIVTGYGLAPLTTPNLFEIAKISEGMNSVIGDIREYSKLKEAFDKAQPEFVIHLAAQPLVRESYENPLYTYETNVMGTVNILECVRQNKCVKSFLNVTTDKVYLNKEWYWGYREDEELNGFDPYSNSKSCSELVTSSYKKSFFNLGEISISTARAGNVIGGGDFSKDRIIPDCVKAATEGNVIIIRNPHSIRPYQHVLEPLFAYLEILKTQRENSAISGSYNIGPNEIDCVNTKYLVKLFCDSWGGDCRYTIQQQANAPHEANYLKLDISKIKNTFGIKPRWNIEEAIAKTVEWSKCYIEKKKVQEIMDKQIGEYLS